MTRNVEEIILEIEKKVKNFNSMRDENWGSNVEFDIAIKSQIRALLDLLDWIKSEKEE